jgi:hypothetical protein
MIRKLENFGNDGVQRPLLENKASILNSVSEEVIFFLGLCFLSGESQLFSKNNEVLEKCKVGVHGQFLLLYEASIHNC